MQRQPAVTDHQEKKWPYRQTFAFLLVLGGCFWIVLGIILKLIF